MFVIWLTRSNDILQLIINNGIALSNFFTFSILTFPEILYHIIPIALFISVITIFMRLRQSSEIFALKNAGISDFDLAKPVFFIAICITILHLSISFYFAPAAKRVIAEKIHSFSEKIGSFLIEERFFIHPTKDITLYADKKNKHGMLLDIFLSDTRDKEKNIVMFAQKGQFVIRDNRSYLDLYNGRRQILTKTGHVVMNFEYFSVNIDIKKAAKVIPKRSVSAMGLLELIKTHQKGDANLIEIYNRFLMPILNILLAYISVFMILKFYKISRTSKYVFVTYIINFALIITFTFLSRMSLDNHIFAYISFALISSISILALFYAMYIRQV